MFPCNTALFRNPLSCKFDLMELGWLIGGVKIGEHRAKVGRE